MIVDGKRMRIKANLMTTGMDRQFAVDAIKKFWSGNHGGHEITVDLDVGDAPTVSLVAWGDGQDAPQGEPAGSGFSDGPRGGSMEVRIQSAARTEGTVAHEFGHVLGLPQASNDPTKLMDEGARGTRIDRAELHQVIGCR